MPDGFFPAEGLNLLVKWLSEAQAAGENCDQQDPRWVCEEDAKKLMAG